ncbi:hypothetical protein ACWIEX_11480 [Bosea sp. NPDC055353]
MEKTARALSVETGVAQFRRRICLSPLAVIPARRQVASGVESRLPETMNAAAKALAGRLKAITFDVATKTLAQDVPSSSHAP